MVAKLGPDTCWLRDGMAHRMGAILSTGLKRTLSVASSAFWYAASFVLCACIPEQRLSTQDWALRSYHILQ